MAETHTRPARRGAFGLVYGLLTALALHVLAEDLPWVEGALGRAVGQLPELVPPAELTTGLAIATVAAFLSLLALGTFLLSRRTGTGFGLWTVATVALLVLPYGRVPWTQLAEGAATQPANAPPELWILSAALIALGTVEIGVCARQRVLAELDRRGLDAGEGSRAHEHTRAALIRWLTVSLIVGALLVLGFALLHPLTERLSGSLDLLWVPALAGLVAGAALWLWARDGRT